MAEGGAAEQPAAPASRLPAAVAAPAADAALPPPVASSPTLPARGSAARADKHDAFISYSHHDEDELRFARALEQGLEQLGKRWARWRALDVFLDQHDLGADPRLARKLQAAIDGSRYFIFLASPSSASPDSWCSKEIDRWFEAKGSEAAAHLFFVLTGGELRFTDTGDDAIDWETSTAAPAVLKGRLHAEPFFIDLSHARGHLGLDIRRDHAFREAVTKLAAPIHGCSPQALDSEDLRQFRRGRRMRRIAVGALAILTVSAVALAAWALALKGSAEARSRQSASRALANEAQANAVQERDLALLQALESVRIADTTDAWGSLLGVLGQPSHFEQRSTGAHAAPVTAIAVSDDGAVAATGDTAGAVVVWEVDAGNLGHPATARPFSPLPGLRGPVDSLAIFERGGQTVIEGVADDGSSVVWDAGTGTVVDEAGVPDVLTGAVVSRDGVLVAGAVDADGDGATDAVRVYKDGALESEAAVDTGSAEHLQFRPDGHALAWSEGSATRLWDLSTSPTTVLGEVASGITSLGFSPDGMLLAVGEAEGNIWLVDLTEPDAEPEKVEPGQAEPATVEPGQVTPIPTSAAAALAFSPDGSADGGYVLASAHQNGQVRTWSVIDTLGFAEETLLGHREETTALALGAGGQIVSGSYDGQLVWWSAAPFVALGDALPAAGDQHEFDVTNVAFLDEQIVVSLDIDGQILLTDLTSSPPAGDKVDGLESGGITALDAGADVLAFSGYDGSIEVVERPTADDSRGFTLSGEHTEAVSALDLSDDGTGLVSIADTTVVWDLVKGDVRSRPDLPDDLAVSSALYGPDGRVWIGGLEAGDGQVGQGVVFEIDAASGAVIGEPIKISQDAVSALALSPDGRTLATGSIDRTIRLWDASTHEPLRDNVLVGHREAVSGLAFTRDGRNLVSVDRDLVVDYWDIADRRLVTTFRGPTDGINDLSLSPDGSSLAVASEDDAVYLWPLDKREWIDRACALAGRNMTEDEWRLYGNGSRRRLCPEYDGDDPPVDWSERLDG